MEKFFQKVTSEEDKIMILKPEKFYTISFAV